MSRGLENDLKAYAFRVEIIVIMRLLSAELSERCVCRFYSITPLQNVA